MLGYGPVIFNLKIIADIFLGLITHWNDLPIVQLNPHLSNILPNRPLLVVYDPNDSICAKVAKMLASIPEFNQTVSAAIT